jgi:hypothetical protein
MSPLKNPFSRATLFAQWAYWCMWGVSIWAQLSLPPSALRTLLTLSPILPGLLIVAVAMWHYPACDEFVRSRILPFLRPYGPWDTAISSWLGFHDSA